MLSVTIVVASSFTDKLFAEASSVEWLAMKTEPEGRCGGGGDRTRDSQLLMMVIMVLVGISTSLLVLSVYLYLQNKKLFKRLR